MKKLATFEVTLAVPPRGMTIPQLKDFIRTALQQLHHGLPEGAIMKTADLPGTLRVELKKVETHYEPGDRR